MKRGRGRILPALLAWASLAAAGSSQAQSYPTRPITAICGFSAGTGADVLTRYFTEKLRVLAGQPVVVENKVGALTVVASDAVAKAKPDGYTIYIAPGNASFATPPHLFKKLPFNPIADFMPVTTLITTPFVLTVSPELNISSVGELTRHLKTRGDKATYAYGTSFGQVASELYKRVAQVPGHPVAYRTGLNSLTDMKSGEIDFMFTDVSSATMQMQQGFLRIIAVTTAERSPANPELPTLREQGLPEFDLAAWWGVWLPVGAPEPVAARLETWFNQIVAMEETRVFLARIGSAPWPGNRQMLAAATPREIEKWGRLIRDANIEPQ
ncbi:MAG TPA: tripartite tricarboxylate transporter substrate-binding protein [Alphaproteobacteria bacterium]